jgi:hypothetical protein
MSWSQLAINTISTSESSPNRTRIKLGEPILRDLKFSIGGAGARIRIYSKGRLIFPQAVLIEGESLVSDTTRLRWFNTALTDFNLDYPNLWAALDYPYIVEVHHFTINTSSISMMYFNTTKEQEERVSIVVRSDNREGEQ